MLVMLRGKDLSYKMKIVCVSVPWVGSVPGQGMPYNVYHMYSELSSYKLSPPVVFKLLELTLHLLLQVASCV